MHLTREDTDRLFREAGLGAEFSEHYWGMLEQLERRRKIDPNELSDEERRKLERQDEEMLREARRIEKELGLFPEEV
jgi:hypothetical protein